MEPLCCFWLGGQGGLQDGDRWQRLGTNSNTRIWEKSPLRTEATASAAVPAQGAFLCTWAFSEPETRAGRQGAAKQAARQVRLAATAEPTPCELHWEPLDAFTWEQWGLISSVSECLGGGVGERSVGRLLDPALSSGHDGGLGLGWTEGVVGGLAGGLGCEH